MLETHQEKSHEKTLQTQTTDTDKPKDVRDDRNVRSLAVGGVHTASKRTVKGCRGWGGGGGG